MRKKIILTQLIACLLCFPAKSFADNPPKKWSEPIVSKKISENILYLPISNDKVKNISIKNLDEPLINLLEVHNPRLKPLSSFDTKYENTYKEFSIIRLGVYQKLVIMLENLPPNIGIAYFEGLRPLHKQKEYFDKKFKEFYAQLKDKEKAYQETSKFVSPFIDNVPTHATGAAIDIALFSADASGEKLLDMGKFDVIFGPNEQQETFSENTTPEQRKNRLLLLNAATTAGLINYGYEWWHYSYGDKAWAFVTKQKEALYGLAVDKNDPILLIDKKSYLHSFNE